MILRSIGHRNLHSSSITKPESRNLLVWLRGLTTPGKLREALSLFYSAPAELQSQAAYAALFHACAQHGDLQLGLHLHRYMLSNQHCSPQNIYVTNHLINMYAKCGCLFYARPLFDEMPERNVVSWTALISGYAQAGHYEECFSLFSTMLVHCRPNEFAMASVLSSCAYKCGKQVHGLSLKMGLDSSAYVANALIGMYGKCHDRAIDEAWTVFRTMQFRNLVSWNSMISAFRRCNLWKEAIYLFKLLQRNGIGFDRTTLLDVISSLCGSSGFDNDLGLKFCLQLHCTSVKSRFIMETEVSTALGKAYSDLGGGFSMCYKLFTEMNCFKDIISWTGIITACADHYPEKALFLFRQLCHEDLEPDWYTYSIVLKACAGLVTTRHASVIHGQLIKAGFEIDTVLNNALIHAYSRCGSIASSKQVFDGMGSRDSVSWNSMLKAYALHGKAEEALWLFSQMDVKPGPETFVSLLSACSHSGLVEEGIKIFKCISDSHGIVPQLDHYACVVDMLGRAGRVVEAEKIINEMPMEPDSVIWSALLGSCRKHGSARLAKLAADKLKELEPKNPLSYVQMSNIYCAGGSFGIAGNTRKEMSRCRVIKEPGLSWIEIRNQVHEFASGGRRHPQIDAIRLELEKLIARLKEIGYVPETNLALQDIEEEHKMEQLFYHSEKLALVFAMMNGGRLGCDGNRIQIMKNIRICVDCHNFMKLASHLLREEIVVRDSNRFHTFKDRICSCNDFW